MKNIKKFRNLEEFREYRATDGWGYPAINYVGTDDGGKQVFYNNEFIMRWYDEDTLKVPVFAGDIKYDDFKTWVENSSWPCEIKKDGTGFNYLRREETLDGKVKLVDRNRLDNGTTSHYSSPDKDDYLQMTEIPNINIGLFSGVDNIKGSYKEVRFNFDKGCPVGFRKWFGKSKFNKERDCYTKLLGRYDAVNTEAGLVCSVGNQIVYSKKWVPKKFKAARQKTNKDLLGITYWEQLVLSFILTAYYKTFNHNTIFPTTCNIQNKVTGDSDAEESGLSIAYTTYMKGDVNEGKVSSFRFMHLENPFFFNKRGGIFTFGYLVSKTDEGDKISIKFDEVLANDEYLKTEGSDVVLDATKREWGKTPGTRFIGEVDLYGNSMKSSTPASSTTGFCASIINTHGPNKLESEKGLIVGGVGMSESQVSALSKEVSYNETDADSSVELRFRLTM